MTLSPPPLLDAPPESDQLTEYDREHFATYLLLLDWSAGAATGTTQSITCSAPTLHRIGIDGGRSMTRTWRELSG